MTNQSQNTRTEPKKMNRRQFFRAGYIDEDAENAIGCGTVIALVALGLGTIGYVSSKNSHLNHSSYNFATHPVDQVQFNTGRNSYTVSYNNDSSESVIYEYPVSTGNSGPREAINLNEIDLQISGKFKNLESLVKGNSITRVYHDLEQEARGYANIFQYENIGGSKFSLVEIHRPKNARFASGSESYKVGKHTHDNTAVELDYFPQEVKTEVKK